jgi:hypothetical protein
MPKKRSMAGIVASKNIALHLMDPTPKMSLLIIYTCSERKQKRLQ